MSRRDKLLGGVSFVPTLCERCDQLDFKHERWIKEVERIGRARGLYRTFTGQKRILRASAYLRARNLREQDRLLDQSSREGAG
ncbi:hypothetical protein ABIE63_001957 [Limibacillus sp. MBR-115]|jgi:hypothetical protein